VGEGVLGGTEVLEVVLVDGDGTLGMLVRVFWLSLLEAVVDVAEALSLGS